MKKLLFHSRRHHALDGEWEVDPTPPDPEPEPPIPSGPTQVVTYTADDTTDFVNPERGWHSDRTDPSHFAGLRTAGTGTHGQVMSLNRYLGHLTQFVDIPITNGWLSSHAAVFSAARSAGIKLDVRYAYSYSTNVNPSDAPLARILGHIDQLAPIWQANYDVISNLQAGFVGRWGEWHSSANSEFRSSDSTARNTVLNALLDAVPTKRMVLCRYPEMQAEMFGGQGWNPPAAVTGAERFTGSDKARLGILNDGFLANPTDTGTFIMNRYTPDYNTNSASKAYWAATSRYVAASGETLDDSNWGTVREAGPLAIADMETYNWDILNRMYSTRVYTGWADTGHYNQISRRLGYRIALTSATLPATLSPGQSFSVSLSMTNSGFGKVYNPRPIDLIVVPSTGPVITIRLSADARRDLPLGGQTRTLDYTVSLPGGTALGNYALHLNLPDEASSIASDPRYAIRLANTGMWNNSTGYNNLNATLAVVAP